MRIYQHVLRMMSGDKVSTPCTVLICDEPEMKESAKPPGIVKFPIQVEYVNHTLIMERLDIPWLEETLKHLKNT